MKLFFQALQSAVTRRILKDFKEKYKELKRKDALYKVAFAFNALHTFTGWKNGRWMCPDCNNVHEQCGSSFLTGRQYPKCCRFEEGHRIYYTLHATK